jgi:Fe-S-cluster containining protein
MIQGKPVRIPVKSASSTGRTAKLQYDCTKCPGYCCSYTLIEIGKRDIARLAKHFGLDYAQAEARFTKYDKGENTRALRHQKDKIFKSVCMFFDTKKRQCTVYEARPGVCRDYPVDTPRCGYYEFLKFEREQQDDPEFIATT